MLWSMDFWIKTKSNLMSGKWVEQSCAALVFFNFLAVFAKFHWTFDLFVNFKPQYLAGSIVLFGACIMWRRKWFALCMAILAVGLFVEIQYSYTTPFAKAPKAETNFTLVQYNKFYYNDNYEEIGAWLRGNDFDVVVVNESLHDAIEPLKKFKDAYPYQFPYTASERFGDLSILSRHPVTVTPIPMEFDGRTFIGSKITVDKEGLEPVTIYAYHANVPIGGQNARRRAFQMKTMAALAGKDESRNVLLMGDWNLTLFPAVRNRAEAQRHDIPEFRPVPANDMAELQRLRIFENPDRPYPVQKRPDTDKHPQRPVYGRGPSQPCRQFPCKSCEIGKFPDATDPMT